MKNRKTMNYEEYKAKEKARLEKEDKELAQQEEELANAENNNNSQEESHDSGDDENAETNENGDPIDDKSNEETEDDKESEDDKKEGDEEPEDENSTDDEEPKDDEDSKNDEEKTEDKESEDPNKVDSEGRKNLGPNRQDDDLNEDKEDKNKGKDESKGDVGDSLKDKAADKIKEKLGNNETIAKAQELGSKAVSAGKSLISAGGFIGKMLVSPVFWIIILLLIVLASISSTVSVIGGNDYNKACDANGIGSVNVAGDADDFTRQAAIGSWLMNTPFEVTGGQPMNKEQVAGIMGNMIQESYGANPRAIQGDHSISSWATCDNNCVLGWGNVNGKALGIVQWDGGRRVSLANFAKSEGTEWHDLTTQLKYLKTEIDGSGGSTYERDMLINGGFGDPTKTIEDYTKIWLEKFERAGVGVLPSRESYARGFYNQFAGAGIGGGSLATQCVGGTGSVDASNLVQLALQIAYTREEKKAKMGYGNCGSLTNCGSTFSKPEYIAAKQMAEQQTSADPISGLYASCDRMAATLYRATGVDPNFPWGSTGTQVAYMDDSSNGWVRISCQERQPGDALAKVGHIMVYLGMIEGRDTIASASIYTRSAHLSDISCKADGKFFADGMAVQGWRKVN